MYFGLFPVSSNVTSPPSTGIRLPHAASLPVSIHHAEGVDGIARKASAWNPNPVRYGISPKASMESRPKGKEEYSLPADAMRGRAAIPYNALCALIPYQASFVGLNKKSSEEIRGFFWWAIKDSNLGPTGYEPGALTN